ncbi:sporadically distributed protein [uncultured Avibacterium sp.]|uniref:Sporadically distributed protein n=1 Tax=uncultured Avibacterium sp. TaxID=1936169 RepID=A0A486XDQ6_9PAST|nr:sporadically distributed protein [uncultured Avibacterium sp.]
MKKMRKRNHKLSIFLLKDSFDEKEFTGAHNELQKSILKIGEKTASLYYKQNPSTSPSWVDLLKKHSENANELASLSNSSCSAVLFMKNESNNFALTFGYGHHLLESDYIQENFGLKVVLNAVDPSKLRSIDAHTLDEVPVFKKNQSSIATSFVGFGFDIEQDLMYAATGIPEDSSFCKSFSGKNSLSISLPFTLEQLPKLLSRLEEFFSSTSYKEKFPWIDNLSEIENVELKEKLDRLLVDKIKRKDFAKTWLIIPDVINWESIKGFRYQKPKRGKLIDEISWETYLDDMDKRKKDMSDISIDIFKSKEYVYCISSSEEKVEFKWSIYKCIYCEINDDKSYCLTNGKWYQVDSDFLEKLNDFIEKLPKSDIKFPDYNGQSEGEYNKSVSESDDDFTLMDGKLIHYGGGSSKIELCDIYSKNKKLIHVKCYNGSSTLSHLFSQGLTSIQLILQDSNFRSLCNEKLPIEYKLPVKNNDVNANDFELIYVILTKGKQQKEPSFFTFV